jgi:hypothetical protein
MAVIDDAAFAIWLKTGAHTCFELGQLAYFTGVSKGHSPYKPGSIGEDLWLSGWETERMLSPIPARGSPRSNSED